MKNILLIIVATFMFASCSAQSQPVPDDMKPLFPSAKSVTVSNGVYTMLSDSKSVLGYAVYSKPASDGIKGFKGETPLLVAFTSKKTILEVVLLPNNDTPSFVKKVADAGLLKAWNGLTVKKAKDLQVDAVAGATYTSTGIIKTMQKTLENTKL